MVEVTFHPALSMKPLMSLVRREPACDPLAEMPGLAEMDFLRDAKIVCRDGSIQWNSILLCQWSALIRAFISDGGAAVAANALTLLLPETDVETMKKILQWSVRGEVLLTSQEAQVVTNALHSLGASVEFSQQLVKRQTDGERPAKKVKEEEEKPVVKKEEDAEDTGGASITQVNSVVFGSRASVRLKPMDLKSLESKREDKKDEDAKDAALGEESTATDQMKKMTEDEKTKKNEPEDKKMTEEEEINKGKDGEKKQGFKLKVKLGARRRKSAMPMRSTAGRSRSSSRLNKKEDKEQEEVAQVANKEKPAAQITNEEKPAANIPNGEKDAVKFAKKEEENSKEDAKEDVTSPKAEDKVAGETKSPEVKAVLAEDKWACCQCKAVEESFAKLVRHICVKHYKQELLEMWGPKDQPCKICGHTVKEHPTNKHNQVVGICIHLGSKHEKIFEVAEGKVSEYLQGLKAKSLSSGRRPGRKSDNVHAKTEPEAKKSESTPKESETVEKDSLTCIICSKQFPGGIELARHLSVTHYKDKLMQVWGDGGMSRPCPVCNVMLTNKGNQYQETAAICKHLGITHKKILEVAGAEEVLLLDGLKRRPRGASSARRASKRGRSPSASAERSPKTPSKEGDDGDWNECYSFFRELHPDCKTCNKKNLRPMKFLHHLGFGHFAGDLVQNFDDEAEKCRLCGHEMKEKKGRNITVSQHMITHHPEVIYDRLRQRRGGDSKGTELLKACVDKYRATRETPKTKRAKRTCEPRKIAVKTSEVVGNQYKPSTTKKVHLPQEVSTKPTGRRSDAWKCTLCTATGKRFVIFASHLVKKHYCGKIMKLWGPENPSDPCVVCNQTISKDVTKSKALTAMSDHLGVSHGKIFEVVDDATKEALNSCKVFEHPHGPILKKCIDFFGSLQNGSCGTCSNFSGTAKRFSSHLANNHYPTEVMDKFKDLIVDGKCELCETNLHIHSSRNGNIIYNHVAASHLDILFEAMPKEGAKLLKLALDEKTPSKRRSSRGKATVQEEDDAAEDEHEESMTVSTDDTKHLENSSEESKMEVDEDMDDSNEGAAQPEMNNSAANEEHRLDSLEAPSQIKDEAANSTKTDEGNKEVEKEPSSRRSLLRGFRRNRKSNDGDKQTFDENQSEILADGRRVDISLSVDRDEEEKANEAGNDDSGFLEQEDPVAVADNNNGLGIANGRFPCPMCRKQISVKTREDALKHLSAAHFRDELLQLVDVVGGNTCGICDREIGAESAGNAAAARRMMAVHVGVEHSQLAKVLPEEMREGLGLEDGGGEADEEEVEVPREEEEEEEEGEDEMEVDLGEEDSDEEEEVDEVEGGFGAEDDEEDYDYDEDDEEEDGEARDGSARFGEGVECIDLSDEEVE